MTRLKTNKRRWILILGLVMVSVLWAGLHPVLAGSPVDHTLWGELLGKYVRQNGVDYKGFQTEEKKLDRYLKKQEGVDHLALDRQERMAFFINVYNAWTIKLILSRWPNLKSIKDLGSIIKSPWKKEIVRLNTGVVNLDHIEHNILRPEFKDPRVHFAVNCA